MGCGCGKVAATSWSFIDENGGETPHLSEVQAKAMLIRAKRDGKQGVFIKEK